MSKHAVILYTIGSPETLTTSATKDYLNRFLSDKLVIKLPRFLWQPILQTMILRSRPARLVERYQKIFVDGKNPYLSDMVLLCSKLQEHLNNLSYDKSINHNLDSEYIVVPAYAYTGEGLSAIAKNFLDQGINKISVIPLFPQYSETTSKRPHLELMQLKKSYNNAQLSIVRSYPNNEIYINALCSITKSHLEDQETHLLITYHSLPQSYIAMGDPYLNETNITTNAIVSNLGLPKERYSVAFQSNMGPLPWLKPYLEEHVDELQSKGVNKLVVLAPGFSTDCLETLYDLDINLKEQFLNHGGDSFTYIPCLNATEEQVKLMADLIFNNLTKI